MQKFHLLPQNMLDVTINFRLLANKRVTKISNFVLVKHNLMSMKRNLSKLRIYNKCVLIIYYIQMKNVTPAFDTVW